MRLATKRQIQVNPKSLGELTVSMLRGERGFQRKEIGKLLDWLRTGSRDSTWSTCRTRCCSGSPSPSGERLNAPICCTLQGEDLFLDGLGEP